ncbi:DUF4118 domain-containing protein [Ensifer adhaerens]|uniref:DUF4118 domain-containing protein n=1 Tax=Ensifer adhaerens TaxID=106592 RepID=UPI0023A9FA6E|nr:DUF4118 domain-containing protein [Ensifer adhaerens]WDZ78214.1 DUF4118 domain-containing protein [Ensifer adhaerens]
MGYLAAVVLTVIATVVAIDVDSGVSIPNLSLIFVVPVVIVPVTFGLGPSVCSAVLGALAYNFFLTEPRYTLIVDDPANIWAIGLLFVVGLIVSGVAFTAQRRAKELVELRRDVTVLQEYCRDVSRVNNNTHAAVSTAARVLAELFHVPAFVAIVSDDQVTFFKCAGDLEPRVAEFEAARLSLVTGTAQRAGTYPTLDSRFDFWPLATTGQGVVVGLSFDPDRRPAAPDDLVDIVGRVLSLAIERQRS